MSWYGIISIYGFYLDYCIMDVAAMWTVSIIAF